MKVIKIDHINIVVYDLDSAIKFFEDLGFINKASKMLSGEWVDKVVGLNGVRAKFASMELPTGGTVIELLKYYTPTKDSNDKRDAANDLGYRHIALEVEDIEHWHANLTDRGVECFSITQAVPNYKSKKLFYFRGPENIIIELTQYPS